MKETSKILIKIIINFILPIISVFITFISYEIFKDKVILTIDVLLDITTIIIMWSYTDHLIDKLSEACKREEENNVRN